MRARLPVLVRLKRHIATLPDGEHEMAANRLLFGGGATVYVVMRHYPLLGLVVAGFYLLLACALLADILRRRRASSLRRRIAIAADMGVITLAMHMGGEQGSLFYALYLWCAFGNGFRFGVPSLIEATATAVVGFAAVIATTPFWQSVPALSSGLMAALIMVPGYACALIGKLSRANEAARAASNAKSMFLAGVSHEFRTPLNAILGSVALLDDTSLDAEQRELAAALDGSTRRLLGLIDSLLDFSRLDAGHMPVQPDAFPLAPLLAEVCTLLRPRARLKRIRLGVHLADNVPDTVFADRRRIQEVLINLVGNAVKFTETGSVLIRVMPLEGADTPDWLRFSVEDTGIGIGVGDRSRIFDSFAQADRTILDRFGGTGLGLAICRQIVELLGGRIGVDSEPGVGSRFWFTLHAPAVDGDVPDLPARRFAVLAENEALRAQAVAAAGEFGRAEGVTDIAAALQSLRDAGGSTILLLQGSDGFLDEVDHALRRGDPVRELPCILLQAPGRLDRSDFADMLVPPALPPGALRRAVAMVASLHPDRTTNAGWIPAADPDRSPLLVLVADDNALNRQVLNKLLERAGHRAILVENGDQAVEAMALHPFDLVLMDVNMPVLSGLDATRMQRLAEIDGSHLPIVALTADPTDEMRARCRDAGMDQCLSKPIAPRTLVSLLDGVERKATGGTLARAAEPDAGVAMLAGHPRFRSVLPVIDELVRNELAALGGEDFVSELMDGFSADARTLVANAARAASADDMPEFRNQLHALRSMSANVGARAIHQEAGTGRSIGSAVLREEGIALTRRLDAELDRFDRILRGTAMSRRAP